MTSKGPAWTRDEDAALVRLAYQGTPYIDIAAQLDRTFAAVAQRICRLRHGRPIDKDRRGNATTALRVAVGSAPSRARLADFGTAALP